MKDTFAYLIAASQLIGVAVLLMCALGNVLLGNWSSVARALDRRTSVVESVTGAP